MKVVLPIVTRLLAAQAVSAPLCDGLLADPVHDR
jgi:hypothetical protein